MSLSNSPIGEVVTIQNIDLRPQRRKHLENLGLTVGANVSVLSRIVGNVIVEIGDSRIAINKQIAERILVV